MNPEDAPPACDTALLAAFSALVSSPTPSVTCCLRRPSRRGASRLSYGKGIPCAGLTLTPGHVVRHAPAARRETPRERERARSGHWTDSKRKIGTPPRSAGCAWCVGRGHALATVIAPSAARCCQRRRRWYFRHSPQRSLYQPRKVRNRPGSLALDR